MCVCGEGGGGLGLHHCTSMLNFTSYYFIKYQLIFISWEILLRINIVQHIIKEYSETKDNWKRVGLIKCKYLQSASVENDIFFMQTVKHENVKNRFSFGNLTIWLRAIFFLFNFDDFFRHFFRSHCNISGNISNIIKVKSFFVVYFYRTWSIVQYINTTRTMN